MPTTRHAVLLAPLLTLALAGCGEDGGTTSGGGGGGGGGGTTTTTAAFCASDMRVTAYSAGLSATSMDGTLKVTFVDAQPTPPYKGNNTWIVDVTDAAGKPVAGATITLKPFMPDHGHGPSVVPTVKDGSQSGRYVIDDIDLFMPGVWQSTLTITPAAGAAEAVVFTFCVDG